MNDAKKKIKKQKKEIKAIIFDIGGVLLTKDWTKISRFMIRKHGFSTKIYSDYPKSIHKKYKGLSTGKISFKDIIKLLSGKKAITKIVKDYSKIHKKHTKLNKNLFKLLKKLKIKYKLYCLTDTNDMHYKFHMKNGIYSHFIKTYASCNIGLKKPDKRCFKLVLKNHKLNPKETIFIDDKKENVKSAKKLGMKIILFKNNRQLITKLKKFGVKI
jgi:putative hydrolase of the HAD superfamily